MLNSTWIARFFTIVYLQIKWHKIKGNFINISSMYYLTYIVFSEAINVYRHYLFFFYYHSFFVYVVYVNHDLIIYTRKRREIKKYSRKHFFHPLLYYSFLEQLLQFVKFAIKYEKLLSALSFVLFFYFEIWLYLVFG